MRFIIDFHHQFIQLWLWQSKPVSIVNFKDLFFFNAVQSTSLCYTVPIMTVTCPGCCDSVRTCRYDFVACSWLNWLMFCSQRPRSAFAHSARRNGLNSYTQQRQMKSLLRKINVIWLKELQLTVNVQMMWDGCDWRLCDLCLYRKPHHLQTKMEHVWWRYFGS